MHKKTTLNNIKELLLKTFLPILVLSISLQASFAQELGLPNKKTGQRTQITIVPVTPPVILNDAAEKARRRSNGSQGNLKVGTSLRLASNGKVNSKPVITPEKEKSESVLNQISAEIAPSDNPDFNKTYTSTAKVLVEPNTPTAPCIFTNSLLAGDLTMPNRLVRPGAPGGTCAVPRPFPGVQPSAGLYFYDTYTFTNTTGASACVVVNLTTTDLTNANIQSAAWLGSFNPASLPTNYIADTYVSTGTPAAPAGITYSFNLANGATAVCLVYSANPNGTAAGTANNYTLSIDGVPSACVQPPPCTPPTASVLSQVLGAPVPATVFSETFNTVVPLPVNWASQNLSNPVGATGWFQGNVGVFPGNTAPGYIAANFNNTTGANIISNWLFAPNVTLKNGDRFTFFTRTTTGTFPDRLQVRMSTNGASVNAGATNTSVGDFTTLLLDINPTYTSTGYPTAWTQFTINLSGLPPAGISGRLAFRYFVEGAGPAGLNSDYIGIDDAVYSTTNPGPPPTTCTGSTTNLQVDITGSNYPTFNVTINAAPGGNFTVNNYTSGNYIPVTPAVTTTYSLVSVVAVGSGSPCVGTGNSGTPTVVVLPTTVGGITIVDNPTGPLCAGSPKLLTVLGAPTPGSSVTNSGPIAVVIPDNNPGGVSTGLTVAGIPAGATGTSASVNFNITHTWDGDLRLFLKAPNNQVLNLVNARGGSADNFVNTTISSTATIPIASGAAPFTGTFLPDGSLAALPPTGFTPTATTFAPLYNTTNLNGTWSFGARDAAGGDVGTITSWGITIGYNIPAGPPVGWTFLWSPASGLSSTTTNPVAASPMTTTTYTVIGTAPNGCNTSAAITILVNQLPAVVNNPKDTALCAGQIANFTVAATGTGITYQWQESTNGGALYTNVTNGGIYSGATSATLTLTGVTVAMNTYRYRCVISGICPPAANSTGGILTVNGLPVIAITPTGPVCGGIAGVNGTLITAGSSAPPIPGSLTFNSGAINIPIPEGNFPNPPATAASNIIAVSGIPANATITGVSVKSNITHAFVGDVVMVVKAPNGAVFNLDALLNITNNSGANFVNTIISSAGTTTLDLGTAPWTGTFKADAVGATFNFFGFNLAGGPVGFTPTTSNWFDLYPNPNGNWTIAAYDAGAPDVGNLTSWELKIDYTTPGGAGSPLTYTWSPAAGLFTNATATIPYIAGAQASSVYAAPAVNTVYTKTGTNGTTGCTNTGTISVIYTPTAPIISPASAAICLNDIQQLTITSALVPSPFTAAYSSGPISVVIPDNNAAGAVSVINVPIPSTAQITSMNVNFNMTHTWAGDVVMVLKAPNGQVLNLNYNISTTGGTGPTSGFTNTTISSTGTAALSTGTNPYTGTFKADAVTAAAAGFGPPGPTGYLPTTSQWSSLYPAPTGNWTLASYDAFAGDQGTLTSWTLNFNYLYGPPATGVWTPNGPGSGLYTDATATTVYTGTSLNTVYAKPTPSGVYPYNVTVTSVGPDATATFTNPALITINDAGPGSPYPSNIAVSGLPTSGVSVNNVVLTGINHTWGDDIDILLQSPTGQNVVLMSDVGGTVAVPNATYTFNDAGPALNPTTANPTGTYRPTNNGAADNWPAPGPGAITQAAPALALFGNTADANGAWKLFVFDDVGGDQGTINGGWRITFNYPTTGCVSPARTVVVTVNQPAAITAQPVNRTVCTDKVTTFTVAASGSAPLSYQWQVSTDNGNNFSNITNGGFYSGATSATLSVTQPPVSYSGYQYRVVVQGALPCPNTTSFKVILTVNPLPTVVISAAPYLKLFPGLVTTLSSTVTPAAVAPGGYTWLRNGAPVAGANSRTLSVDVDRLGDYRLTVTDVNGCTNTSNMVSITDSITGRCYIYPNPNSGQFQVRYFSAANNVLPRTLTVYDAKGDRVLTQIYTIGRPYDRMDVDLRKYGKGLYWVEIGDVNGNRLTMCRVAIQ